MSIHKYKHYSMIMIHMQCAVCNYFTFKFVHILSYRMKGMMLLKTNLLIIFNRFLKKYLNVTFVQVFDH